MGEFRYIGTAALLAKGRAAIYQAVVDAGDNLAEAAQDRAREDTGAERAGIRRRRPKSSGNTVTVVVSTSQKSSQYDVFQHEGTHKMSGTHFISGPLIENRDDYLRRIASAARGAY